MKAAFSLAAALLVGAAVAQPHRRHHAHNDLDKRVIVTATIWETLQAPDAVVYVDENGNPIDNAAPTPAPVPASNNIPAAAPAIPSPAPVFNPAPPAPAPPAATTLAQLPKPVAPAPAPAPAPPAPAPAPPAPAPAPAPVPADSSSDASTKGNFVLAAGAPQDAGFMDAGPQPYGVTWTGYKGDEGNSACKTMADADSEWSQLGAFKIVRVYGTDCDQPNIAMTLAAKYNKKVFLGVYDLDSRLPGEVGTIIKAVRNSDLGWDAVDTISIGNEDVHRGEKTPAGIVAAVNIARSMLRPSGYRGPVVHVDSQDAILANPTLCSWMAGDYIAANIHAFFNPNTPADQAGEFVASQVSALRACGAGRKRRNVRVRVTETGWPKEGEANGAAVPSKANQQAAIASIKKKLGNDVFLFSAFNNYWMHNSAGTFNAEHYWGIMDN